MFVVTTAVGSTCWDVQSDLQRKFEDGAPMGAWLIHADFFIVLLCVFGSIDLPVQDLMELIKVIQDSLQLRQHPTVCSAPPSQHQRPSTCCPGTQSPATTDSYNDLNNTGNYGVKLKCFLMSFSFQPNDISVFYAVTCL